MYFHRNNPFNYKIVSDNVFNRSISDFLGSDVTLNQAAANVVEKSDSFLIDIAAPGLKKDDFKIKLEQNKLIVATELANNTVDSEAKYTRREFDYKSFTRSFILPKEANKDEISANYVNGILKITLLKKEEEKEKEAIDIEIK